MSWDELGAGARELAEAVAADGYVPDMILGIARGGLLVAGAIGYALGVKNTFTMNVEFYTGIDERLDMPMILPPVPDLVDFPETKGLIAAVSVVLAVGTSPGKAKSNAAFKAAWIYVGPHADGGWSQAHDVGRLYVQKALGSQVKTTYKELVPEGPQTCQVIDQLVRDGN